MAGMSLLPEELQRPQECARPLFPADGITPLIDQDRQIAVALHPARIAGTDDGFRGRPHRPRLLQIAVAAAGDPGHLRGKPLDVVGLPLQHRSWNKEWEVGVLDPGCLDPRVEPSHHQLPQTVAIRPDHLAATHGRVVGESRLLHDLDVPAVEVVLLVDQFLDVSTISHGHLHARDAPSGAATRALTASVRKLAARAALAAARWGVNEERRSRR